MRTDKTDPLKIADLVADPDAPEWLDYPGLPSFRVLLSSPDNPARVRLATRAAVIPGIPEQDAEFHFLKVRQSVAGWEGLAVADLPRLFPGKKLQVDGAEDSAELAYNPENLDFLLRKSEPFYRWVNAQINAREAQEAADEKNSLAMPTTSPTPTPGPARDARKKRSSTA